MHIDGHAHTHTHQLTAMRSPCWRHTSASRHAAPEILKLKSYQNYISEKADFRVSGFVPNFLGGWIFCPILKSDFFEISKNHYNRVKRSETQRNTLKIIKKNYWLIERKCGIYARACACARAFQRMVSRWGWLQYNAVKQITKHYKKVEKSIELIECQGIYWLRSTLKRQGGRRRTRVGE